MTTDLEITPKLSGKLPKDSSLRGLARFHFDQGVGHTLTAVVKLRVDRIAEGSDTDEVHYVIDSIEAPMSTRADEVAALHTSLYRERTTGDSLPFPGTPGYDDYRLEKLTQVIAEWATENEHGPQDLQELWNGYFGDVDTPHGPVGASFVHLQEFALAKGAISDEAGQDDLFKQPAEADTEDDPTAEPGDYDQADDEPNVEDLPAGVADPFAAPVDEVTAKRKGREK